MIQNEGNYRGIILEHGVGTTKESHLPQWQVCVRALEMYDAEEKQWVDISGEAGMEITGYLVLFNKEGKPIFHIKDIQEALEWDGKSLVELNNMDLTNAAIQFRVKEEEYEGQTRIKLAGVSPYDAEPSIGGVQKVDNDTLQALQKKFGALLNKEAKPATPKKAPSKKKKPTPPKPKEEDELYDQYVDEVVPDGDEDDESDKTPPPETKKAKPAPPAPPKKKDEPKDDKSMTKDEAWSFCYQHKAETVDDSVLADAWLRAVNTVSNGEGEEAIDDKGWAKVCDIVCDECGVF